MAWRVKILERKFLDEDHYLLKTEKPKNFSFKPGQFVGITSEINGEKVKRFYSIASLPGEDFLLFYIKRVPGGKMSNFLAGTEIGTELELDGPYGKFTLERSKEDRIYFIASGTGIAPVRPLVYQAIKEGRSVVLVHQERYERLLVFREEFERLPIKYIPILSREERTNLLRGHVQDYLDEILDPNADYFLVGSPAFVSDLSKELKKRGVKNIIIEAF